MAAQSWHTGGRRACGTRRQACGKRSKLDRSHVGEGWAGYRRGRPRLIYEHYEATNGYAGEWKALQAGAELQLARPVSVDGPRQRERQHSGPQELLVNLTATASGLNQRE